jgi:hypothetical protein
MLAEINSAEKNSSESPSKLFSKSFEFTSRLEEKFPQEEEFFFRSFPGEKRRIGLNPIKKVRRRRQ